MWLCVCVCGCVCVAVFLWLRVFGCVYGVHVYGCVCLDVCVSGCV